MSAESPAGRRPQVILYTRAGCHLCDQALDGLLALRSTGYAFDLHEIDIDSDDALHRRLVERIPVIEMDGIDVCELFFDPDALISRLATVEG